MDGLWSGIFAHTLPVHKVSWDLPRSQCRWVGRAEPGVHGTLVLDSLSSGLWAVAWHWCGLLPLWCLAFLACQTSMWQRFPTVSVTGGFIDRCHRMPGKSGHDTIMFCQRPRCSLVIHWCSACTKAHYTHYFLCAIARHAQPCALGHGSLYLALDQGKVMMFLWAVSMQKL